MNETEPRRLRRWWRRARRTGLVLAAGPLAYGMIVLIGLVPVNRDFEPAPEGIEIRIVSTAVHADVIVPLVTDEFDWLRLFPRDLFRADTHFATHAAIGWGDRGFFLETPTWDDLTLSTAARALLWPTDSCVHVTMTRAERWRGQGRTVRISRQQYRKLVEFILDSLVRDADGSVRVIPEITYGNHDLFVEARGRYHCLHTCNSWVGQAMRQAGIKTPWLTPLPRTMFLWLPPDRPSDRGEPDAPAEPDAPEQTVRTGEAAGAAGAAGTAYNPQIGWASVQRLCREETWPPGRRPTDRTGLQLSGPGLTS